VDGTAEAPRTRGAIFAVYTGGILRFTLAGYWPASGATCAFSSAVSRRDFAPIVPRQQRRAFCSVSSMVSGGILPGAICAVSSAVSGGDFAPPTAAQFARRPTFRFPRAGPPAARWRRRQRPAGGWNSLL